MRKQVFYLLSFICIWMTAYVEAEIPIIGTCDNLVLEFRASYYYPTSSDFRKFFDPGVNYQISGTYYIFPECDIWLNGVALWAAVDYYTQDRKFHFANAKSRVNMVPATVGLRYYFPSCYEGIPVDFYVGAGFKYYFLQVHNRSDFFEDHVKRKGLGGVFEGGFTFTPCQNFFIDIFGSYSYKKFGAHNHRDSSVRTKELDVSGFNVGGGIGYAF